MTTHTDQNMTIETDDSCATIKLDMDKSVLVYKVPATITVELKYSGVVDKQD